MPTFSIIIPVYNVEAYLSKCLDSILAQRCQDFEVLLIDDGSKDGSGAICDRYAQSHPGQIRAIHQTNGGAGAARNQGIEQARGTYLLFVDGDDYLSDNLLSDLAKAIAREPADLYLFGALVERDGKVTGQLHEAVPPGQPVQAKSHPALFFGVMAPWNRAYCRRLFDDPGIRFATRVWYEDIRIVTKILALAQRVVRLGRRLLPLHSAGRQRHEQPELRAQCRNSGRLRRYPELVPRPRSVCAVPAGADLPGHFSSVHCLLGAGDPHRPEASAD